MKSYLAIWVLQYIQKYSFFFGQEFKNILICTKNKHSHINNGVFICNNEKKNGLFMNERRGTNTDTWKVKKIIF